MSMKKLRQKGKWEKNEYWWTPVMYRVTNLTKLLPIHGGGIINQSTSCSGMVELVTCENYSLLFLVSKLGEFYCSPFCSIGSRRI